LFVAGGALLVLVGVDHELVLGDREGPLELVHVDRIGDVRAENVEGAVGVLVEQELVDDDAVLRVFVVLLELGDHGGERVEDDVDAGDLGRVGVDFALVGVPDLVLLRRERVLGAGVDFEVLEVDLFGDFAGDVAVGLLGLHEGDYVLNQADLAALVDFHLDRRE
jgi:hypothetical protein